MFPFSIQGETIHDQGVNVSASIPINSRMFGCRNDDHRKASFVKSDAGTKCRRRFKAIRLPLCDAGYTSEYDPQATGVGSLRITPVRKSDCGMVLFRVQRTLLRVYRCWMKRFGVPVVFGEDKIAPNFVSITSRTLRASESRHEYRKSR